MSRRILLIEDNAQNAKLFTRLLALDGHEVATAVEAEHGLTLARQAPPDLVLMDLQLPGMDGLAATRRFKTDPSLAHIPVVALTAHAMPEDEERAREAGCDGFITKPIDTRRFRTTVAGYLEGK
jgi:CheY-like chemotaxis protein